MIDKYHVGDQRANMSNSFQGLTNDFIKRVEALQVRKRNRNPKAQQSFEHAIRTIITDLWKATHCIPLRECLINKRSGYYSESKRYRDPLLTYNQTMAAFDGLLMLECVEVTKEGYFDRTTLQGSLTKFVARDELLERLQEIEDYPALSIKQDLNEESIILRDVIDGRKKAIGRNLQLQIANALDDAALDGSGSSGQPTGISNTSNIETFATAGSSTMTYAESLDAMAEVAANNFDTMSGTWLINPTNAATLGAQTVDSGSGRFVYQDGRITGRRAIETTHVAAGTAFFGLFDNVMIGMFGGVDIVTDPYTNGSTGVVKIYVYQMADVAVAHAGTFQKVTLTA